MEPLAAATLVSPAELPLGNGLGIVLALEWRTYPVPRHLGQVDRELKLAPPAPYLLALLRVRCPLEPAMTVPVPKHLGHLLSHTWASVLQFCVQGSHSSSFWKRVLPLGGRPPSPKGRSRDSVSWSSPLRPDRLASCSSVGGRRASASALTLSSSSSRPKSALSKLAVAPTKFLSRFLARATAAAPLTALAGRETWWRLVGARVLARRDSIITPLARLPTYSTPFTTVTNGTRARP
mmetsp:Transcript_3386/g.11946  ORF Transcript_3386/g.11946 Transcript_3386/m.11946 type:complete len:236 (-) Transcript_3386:236-943(-)